MISGVSRSPSSKSKKATTCGLFCSSKNQSDIGPLSVEPYLKKALNVGKSYEFLNLNKEKYFLRCILLSKYYIYLIMIKELHRNLDKWPSHEVLSKFQIFGRWNVINSGLTFRYGILFQKLFWLIAHEIIWNLNEIMLKFLLTNFFLGCSHFLRVAQKGFDI